MRADAGPRIRRWLAAIIKAGPVERAGEKRTRGKNLPPSFRRRCVSRMIHVVSADVTFRFIVRVNAAGEIFTAHFRADGWKFRKLGVNVVYVLTRACAAMSATPELYTAHS